MTQRFPVSRSEGKLSLYCTPSDTPPTEINKQNTLLEKAWRGRCPLWSMTRAPSPAFRPLCAWPTALSTHRPLLWSSPSLAQAPPPPAPLCSRLDDAACSLKPWPSSLRQKHFGASFICPSCPREWFPSLRPSWGSAFFFN